MPPFIKTQLGMGEVLFSGKKMWKKWNFGGFIHCQGVKNDPEPSANPSEINLK